MTIISLGKHVQNNIKDTRTITRITLSYLTANTEQFNCSAQWLVVF